MDNEDETGSIFCCCGEIPYGASTSIGPASRCNEPADNAGLDVASLDIDDAVKAAWNSLQHSSMKPAWETGFWSTIFGDDVIGNSLKQEFSRPIEPPSMLCDSFDSFEINKKQRVLEVFDKDIPSSRSCVKHTVDSTWQETRDAQLQKALKRWAVTVEGWDPKIEFVATLVGCENINVQIILLGTWRCLSHQSA